MICPRPARIKDMVTVITAIGAETISAPQRVTARGASRFCRTLDGSVGLIRAIAA
jgi:hypothetical protein